MLKALIIIDDWKVKIFREYLDEAKFSYEVTAGLTHDTLSITVHTDNLSAVGEVVKEANTAAARSKLQ